MSAVFSVDQVENVLAGLACAHGVHEVRLVFGAAKTRSSAAVEIQISQPDDWEVIGKGSTLLDALRNAVDERQQQCLKQAIDVERERARASEGLRVAEDLVRQVRAGDAGGAA